MSQLKKTLYEKLDKYFADFVVPAIDPTNVVWAFSMSGGVDSWAARDLVRYWYGEKGITFRETQFHINQWNAPIALTYNKQPSKVVTLSAQDLTRETLKYVPGDKAPCSSCSGVRHDFTDLLTDTLVRDLAPTDFLVVVRGHHLSDLAISLLWRFLVGKDPASAMFDANKGHPFQALKPRVYLAKPLIYVLKGELNAYAEESGTVGNCACIACPAHDFPSRRDIVNETAGVLLAKQDAFWELSTPGIDRLFERWTKKSDKLDDIRALSQNCQPAQHEHFPSGAIDRVEEFYDNHLDRTALDEISKNFVMEPTLDELAVPVLFNKVAKKISGELIPIPKYLLRCIRSSQVTLSHSERMMLLCMGPFWASFVLPDNLRNKLNEMRAALFPDLLFDDQWSQAGHFVKWYSTR